MNVFQPFPMEVPRLVFIPMGVPLASISAIRGLHHRYDWPSDDKLAKETVQEQGRTIDTWQRAIAAYLDEHGPGTAMHWHLRRARLRPATTDVAARMGAPLSQTATVLPPPRRPVRMAGPRR